MRRVWSSLMWLAFVYLIATGAFLADAGTFDAEAVQLWIGITYLPLAALAVLVACFAAYWGPSDHHRR